MRAFAPHARPAWILHQDDALLVADKPAGISSQSADPDAPDDLPYRLRAFFAEQGAQTYLGIHQRLDLETSGLLVYARRKDANASLARQFEGRTVDKRYLAVVTGYEGGPRRLVHRLAPLRGERVELARPGDRRAREAVTAVRVLERRGARALLELRIETGRTHQIRAQLAAIGAPIVGDTLYGGVPAERMMLHASAIMLEHPADGRRVRYESRAPAALRRALEGQDFVPLEAREALDDALERAVDRRYGLLASLARGGLPFAIRLLHRDGDGVPDLALDLYDRHLVAHLYCEREDPGVEIALEAISARFVGQGVDGLYVKHRPRAANRAEGSGRGAWAASEPVVGAPAPSPLRVYEGTVPFDVRLDDGLSTGLFLDQRDNRARLREASRGAQVLNLFAYTCGFSLAAAHGGAKETVSVDAARAPLEIGEAALGASGLGGTHQFVRADVFETLARFAADGRRFDRIVCDPPTYSSTRRGRWASQSAWEGLVEAIVRVAAPGAIVLLSSNDQRMTAARFRRYVHRGVEAAGGAVARLRDLPAQRDFPPPPGRPAHMKALWLELA